MSREFYILNPLKMEDVVSKTNLTIRKEHNNLWIVDEDKNDLLIEHENGEINQLTAFMRSNPDKILSTLTKVLNVSYMDEDELLESIFGKYEDGEQLSDDEEMESLKQEL